ncbi:3-methylcrotonyl-CoA carboxylase beta subunit [Tistlia consotensis]|uniref:3-methylcrotonyl-CoA carboxylase beta subunit n=1 Tax=Tistlia consotensis USBA 355 TaxID=560819 RepID=A0A1Y6CK77_9PROT|nr:carboxyl transferase domain-containing protein [Tistlia consotensis]SMF72336.1 3-methylcrotonyl-CoA carboxylase beta subunit [Tistlia consotensis USBA 355]SNS08888.1 3-methylcrotonyl-CoA carboxylase beta subunit [Tistlia consotensis]
MAILTSALDPRSAGFQANREAYEARLATLRERLAHAASGGRGAHVGRHKARGKLLVRDRIDLLLDPGSPFLEVAPLAAWGQYGNEVPGAGAVAGIGLVERTPVMIVANDATVKGGSFYRETVKKHVRAQEIAEQQRLPCLYLVDCGGANLPQQDQVFPDKDHFGNTFLRQCRMSAAGLAQVSAVFGGCTAGGAYIPALSDEVVMVEGQARIHLGGPSIVKVAINEEIDGESLGGAAMHTRVSGVSDWLAADEPEALAKLREIVASLAVERDLSPPRQALPPRLSGEELAGVVPADRRQPYDVREVLARLVDDSDFVEFKPEWGATLVAGTARIHGFPVGILGNNGPLYSDSSLKAAHFIQLCDQRRIPLLFLQNISGFMVGGEAERGGIAKDSAKMVYAMATARVPRLTVILGGSYGAGNYGMCGRGFWPDFLFAWPTAECATMSADIAANVMLELRRSSVRQGPPGPAELAAIEKAVRDQYAEQSDPYYATSRLWDDGILEPAQTRDVLGLCLALAASRGEAPPRDARVFRL